MPPPAYGGTEVVIDNLARGLLAHGVYPPPSQFEAWFTSTLHGDAEFAATAEAFDRALEAMA